jgi:ethanolamine utilization protein EutA
MTSPLLSHGRPETVSMIGLDFGSTTSSAMLASARVGMNAVTGRMEFGTPRVLYRSEPVFTPFRGKEIDPVQLNRHVAQWTAESGVLWDDIFAGGVIITGLAAQRTNADTIARMVGGRFSEAVVATADDPCLESWLAFMGSCSVLSRFHAKTPFINLDIGGGTTNSAYGLNGNVLHTGCHFLGARHFQFEPGGYRLTGMSSHGRSLLTRLGIEKGPGKRLTSLETEAVLGFYITALEAVATGDTGFFADPDTGVYQQVPFAFDRAKSAPVVVFSGGVGELVYRQSRGKKMPDVTHYGDLGIDLAVRIAASPILAAHIDTLVPENSGRATVYGLALHSTEISGSTIFLPTPDVLPCRNLPIVARLPVDAAAETVHQAVSLVGTSPAGACIQVLAGEDGREKKAGASGSASLASVKMLGARLHQAYRRSGPTRPVVLLVPYNYGQTLGNYATNWRQSPFDLIVIDEISDRQAHFVNIGSLANNIVPVSFYGIC